MNVNLKKIKIIKPKIKINPGIKVVNFEKKFDFFELSGRIIPTMNNPIGDIIVGFIEEV